MSLWMDATIHLNPDHLDESKDPLKAVKEIFKKFGKDFDEDFSEAKIKRVTRFEIEVSICNPEGYVDTIHESFKFLSKSCAYVQYVDVKQNYYM